MGRLSEQVLQVCHVYIINVEFEDSRSNLWKKTPEKLCAAIQECLQLREVYIDNFKCVPTPVWFPVGV